VAASAQAITICSSR